MLVKMMRSFGVAVGCLVAGLGAAFAEVPAAPRTLTAPPLGAFDSHGDVVALPTGGFFVAYTRGLGINMSLRGRQFGPTGLPVAGKAEVQIVAPGIAKGVRPKMVLASASTVAMVWQQGDRVVGGLFNLTTNRMGPIRDYGKAGDLVHELVKLNDGKFAFVHVDDSSLREKVSVTLLSSAMTKIGGPFSMHGNGFALDAWNSFDHTIVSKAAGGGFVFFRDRVTGNVMMRPFGANGAATGVITRVNTTRLLIGTLSEYVQFEVRATRLTSGKIVVVWSGYEFTGANGFEVRARVLSANGSPIGNDFRVHAASTGSQNNPEVLALPNDRFVVTWVDDENILSRKLTMRTYNSSGAALYPQRVTEAGSAFALGNYTDMAFLRDGSIVNLIPGIISFGSANKLKAEGFRP
jgi:hypothetical protein